PTVTARRAARAQTPRWRTAALTAAGLAVVALSALVIVQALWPGAHKGPTTEPAAAPAATRRPKAAPAHPARTPNALTDPARSLAGVTDFREVHGVSRQALLDWQRDLGPDLRLIALSSQKGAAEPRFNAVAVRERNPLVSRFFPDLTDEEGPKNFSRV